MECYIVKEGVERKAGLEDILSLFSDKGIQYIFWDVLRANNELPYALAHLPNEIKEKVYSKLAVRIRHRIEKEVKAIEHSYGKHNGYLIDEREKLITFIVENYRGWLPANSERIVWKETESKEPVNYIEELKKTIEEALVSGLLRLSFFDTDKMTEADVLNAFMTFQNRKDELRKIRTLDIYMKDLPAAALLFEAGGINSLSINGEFNGTWPLFLEKCQTLTFIYLNLWKGLTEIPSWIRNAVSLCSLYIESNITLLPDWIGDMQSLTALSIYYTKFKTLPDSIGNLKNLTKFEIHSDIETLPESICNLSSLKELSLLYNDSLKTLPDNIRNLKNLTSLKIWLSSIESLPDSIGDLENLTELSLCDNKKLKFLPDSIGKLRNLITLDISSSAIEKLPDSIANCTSLECVDIRDTNIKSIPDFLYSIKNLLQTIEVKPISHVSSYCSFCNCFFLLAKSLFQFAEKAIEQGILSIEEELYYITDIFFREGLRLLVNGTDDEIIRSILTLKIERECSHYKKKLMEIAMEGILCIQRRDSIPRIGIKLASMVSIKNNPLDAAFAKYLAGDYEAFDNIDFFAALMPEEEREEIRFIKRVLKIWDVFKEGSLGLEKHLDNNGIIARDVFEYGLCLMVECWDYKEVDKVLSKFIADETDPVRKNFSLAKKEAVKMLYEEEISIRIAPTLLAYFDDDVAKCFWEADNA
ncbi:hypothetical protein R84B8_00046 [Treponema sp. R8-4-B8]